MARKRTEKERTSLSLGTPFFKISENARKNAVLETGRERNKNAALKKVRELKQDRRSQN